MASQQKKLCRGLFYYGPLVAWLSISLILSTKIGGYDASVSFIYGLFAFIDPNVSPPDIDSMYGINHLARQGAYVLVYGITALLLVRAFQGGHPKLKRGSVLGVLGFGSLFAFMDNMVRNHSQERHGGWNDLFLSFGSLLLLTAILFFYFAIKFWERNFFESEGSSLS